jgi:glycosyltransferase involved in cell wall biosynthesis
VKIALLGNMNNNNFALLRYFRELGVDAHLLLMSNDGKGVSAHFTPEADTCQLDKWLPYIHQTTIPEDVLAAFDFPLSWVLSARSYFRSLTRSGTTFNKSVSRRKILKELDGYSHYIGSGIMPAVMGRVGKRLDIFYPYALGVEYLGDIVFNSNKNKRGFIGSYVFNSLLRKQKKGILDSRTVINSEISITEAALKSINVQSVRMFVPIVYSDETPSHLYQPELEHIIGASRKSQFVVVAHARLMWSKPSGCSDEEWISQNKNNNKLIHAFYKLVLERPQLSPILVLFEYGPDVDETKLLIEALGIAGSVYWAPKSERKHIIGLISKADVGIGEFYDIDGVLWGATALEVMSCGKPVIQGLSFSNNSFHNAYGFPLPPILAANSSGKIFEHLLELADDPIKRRDIGELSKKWFDKFCGKGLAKKWLNLLNENNA